MPWRCFFSRLLGYGWTLEGHDNEHALAIEVEDLHFRFHPMAAGRAFSVENKGDEDATIDWSQSYFMAPDGTSTRRCAPNRSWSAATSRARSRPSRSCRVARR